MLPESISSLNALVLCVIFCVIGFLFGSLYQKRLSLSESDCQSCQNRDMDIAHRLCIAQDKYLQLARRSKDSYVAKNYPIVNLPTKLLQEIYCADPSSFTFYKADIHLAEGDTRSVIDTEKYIKLDLVANPDRVVDVDMICYGNDTMIDSSGNLVDADLMRYQKCAIVSPKDSDGMDHFLEFLYEELTLGVPHVVSGAVYSGLIDEASKLTIDEHFVRIMKYQLDALLWTVKDYTKSKVKVSSVSDAVAMEDIAELANTTARYRADPSTADVFNR